MHLVRTQKFMENWCFLPPEGVRNISFWENFAYVLNESLIQWVIHSLYNTLKAKALIAFLMQFKVVGKIIWSNVSVCKNMGHKLGINELR